MSTINPGLWLVATPIGNLDDMSPRAVEVLRAADLIMCEDTRHSGKLFSHFGISGAPLVIANEHTEHDVIERMSDVLASGKIVAVVTDAGTPAISDPGERLVAAAVRSGHAVHATPGPAAFVMAATLSGLPTRRLAFDGFLPRAGAERRTAITEIAHERRTTIIYEAPHRVTKTIDELAQACGLHRRVAIARELTKMHESVWRGTLGEAIAHVNDSEPRGEYVIVIEPADNSAIEVNDETIANELRARLANGISKRDAVDEVTTALGVPRNRVYAVSLTL